jgi:hypothetical protein
MKLKKKLKQKIREMKNKKGGWTEREKKTSLFIISYDQ